jgi:2-polyprenyl-3-methyl-5-hydroxy-6-metoxy-1,4-benzoquinol methylase
MVDPSEQAQKAFWDDWVYRSFSWKNDSDNRRRGFYVISEVVNRQKPGLKILDVGCGSGWLSLELKKFGKVTGTDYSQKSIEKLNSEHPDVNWIAGDFLSIDLPENFYDIVTCLETIAHVSNQMAFAEKMAKVTRRGGFMILTTQNQFIWKRTSSLAPLGKGQIRNWLCRKRLRELFGSYYYIQKLFTCAPGGDRGFPWIFNNRYSNRIFSNLLGDERYIRTRELIGLGKSLVIVGQRFVN